MVAKHVGLNRILKLADFMETVPRKKFDFSVIVGSNWGGKVDLSCGTTACALGWATTVPLFRKLGLILDDQQVRLGNCWGWYCIAKHVFGISMTAMTALFDPSYTPAIRYYDYDDEGRYLEDWYVDDTEYPRCSEYATPKQWARHARKIVKILQKAA